MYYLFEMHDSDGNDNSITDVIVTASSKDQAFDVIARSIVPPYADSGLGDDDLAIYEYWKYYDGDGNEYPDGADIPEDNEGICYSSSFYFKSEHDTLDSAEKEHGYYHGGIVYLEDETETEDNRCDQCEASMINGVYCHETGCPNTLKVKIDG